MGTLFWGWVCGWVGLVAWEGLSLGGFVWEGFVLGLDCRLGGFVLGRIFWGGFALGWSCCQGWFVVGRVCLGQVCLDLAIGDPNNAYSIDLHIIIYLLREGIFQILQTFSQGKCGAGRLPIFISTESNQSQ